MRLTSGELRGMRTPVPFQSISPVGYSRKIFSMRENGGASTAWFYSDTKNSSLIQSPMVNETLGRWYLFEEGRAPQVFLFDSYVEDNATPFKLSIPVPAAAPTLGAPEVQGANPLQEVRVYAISYVTEWGEESAVSPAATIQVPLDENVTVKGLYSIRADPLEGRDWAYVRLYRTVYGQQSSQLYFVADIPWGDEEFVDDVPSAEVVLNGGFPQPNDPPPVGLEGARLHPSGSIVAFKGRDLHFSRPYLPHAWPEGWRLTVEDHIVAVEVVNNQILVLTKGRPVVLYGDDASSMGKLTFPVALPCINYSAVVGMPEGVYFPSYDGLVLLTGQGPQIITSQMISPDQWQRDYLAEDMYAVRDGSKYLAICPSKGCGFAIEQSPAGMSTYWIEGTDNIRDLTVDKWTGKPYALVGPTEIYEWEPSTGPDITYSWKSREYYHPAPIAYGALQAEFATIPRVSDGGPLDISWAETDGVSFLDSIVVRVYGDGDLIASVPVKSGDATGIPTGSKCSVWQFEIIGQCPVHSLTISETPKGLGRG